LIVYNVWENFQSYSIDGLSVRCDRKLVLILKILLWITLSNMLQMSSNFKEINSNTIIIPVPNLKEIEWCEDGFHKF